MMFMMPMPPTMREITAMDEIKSVRVAVVDSMVLRIVSALKMKKSLRPWRAIKSRVTASAAWSAGASSRIRAVMLRRDAGPRMRPMTDV